MLSFVSKSIARTGQQQSRRFFSTISSSNKGYIYLAYPHRVTAYLKKIYLPLLATKIGFTREPEKRKACLQTGYPLKLVLEPFPCDPPEIFEKYWHNEFKNLHVRGEWFNLQEWHKEIVRIEMDFYNKTGRFPGNHLLKRYKK